MDDAERTINKAIDILKNVGWCQGAWGRDSEGHPVNAQRDDIISYCLIGSVDTATRALRVARGTNQEVRARLGKLLPKGIAHFNDADGRKFEEVLEVLEKAKTTQVPPQELGEFA